MLRTVLNTWCKFHLYWVSGVVVLIVPVLLLVVVETCLRVKRVVWRASEVGPLVHYRAVFTEPLPCAGCGGEQAGLQRLRLRRGPHFGPTRLCPLGHFLITSFHHLLLRCFSLLAEQVGSKL